MTAPVGNSRLLLAAFAAAAVVSGLAIANLSPSQLWSTPRLVGYVLAPILVGLMTAWIAWRRPSWSGTVLVYLASAGLAAVLAEIVLAQAGEGAPALAKAQTSPVAPPHFCPASLPGGAGALTIGGRTTLPLTGISQNPLGIGIDGQPRTTDERGFNNPAGLWSDPPVDIAAVGDSFTFGADVPIGAGFVDRIRAKVPATVNLGCGGNGPISELATLIEYGPALRPRLVLWVFYEGNDLTKDALNELRSPVLARYLQPSLFRQDLMLRQQEIEEHLRGLMMPRPAGGPPPIGAPASLDWRATATLTTLRTRLGFRHAYAPTALATFEAALQRSVALVKGWGGRLVFVHLPAETRFTSAIARADARGYAGKVHEVVAKYGVPLIDVAARLENEPNPRGLYRGHFTAEGYAKTADIILQELNAKRLIRR